MVTGSNIRRGMVIKLDGEVYLVTEYQHVKPGKGPAYMQAALKNLKTGRIIRNRFRSTDNVELAELETKRVQYLYKDSDNYYFMDMKDYNTISVDNETVGDNRYFLKEEMLLDIAFYEGSPITFELPTQVSLKIAETGPGIRGDSVTSNTKPATLETGLTVQVPLFINSGDVVRIDTRTGEYLGRE